MASKWSLLPALVALLVVAPGCRTAPIYNVRNESIFVGTNVTLDEVGNAIALAGESLGWSMVKVAPGRMRGTITVRRHTAVVGITYDTREFSIQYLDSTNLRYAGDRIHKNYNGWVKRLEQAIQNEVALRLR